MILATTRRRRGDATPCRPRVLGPLIIMLLLILLWSGLPARAATEPTAKKDAAEAATSAEQLAKEIKRLQEILQRLTEEQKKEIEELRKRIAQLEKKLREAETERKKEELEQILADAEAATAEEKEKEEEAKSQRDVFVGRQRNLQAMNPEISFLGDVSYGWTDSEVRDEFLLRGAELSLQAPLDPYTRFKSFLAAHQHAALLEHDLGDPANEEHAHEGEVNLAVGEAYMEWVALPANMRLRVGKFRQEFGTFNRWHIHALPSVEIPFALRANFGGHGLVGLGFGIDWQLPGFWATSNGLTLEVVNADNDVAFAGSGFRDPTYLLRHTGFFDLGPDMYFELGLNGVIGPNQDEGDLYTTVASVDFNFVWEPVQRAKYRSVEVRGEFTHTHRETADTEAFKSTSFYTYLSWRLSRRWIVGLRYDDAELPSPDIELLDGQTVVEGLRERAWSPFVTFWQSEFVRLRLQYQHASRDFAWAYGPEDDDRVWIQVTFAAGPHKHEAY